MRERSEEVYKLCVQDYILYYIGIGNTVYIKQTCTLTCISLYIVHCTYIIHVHVIDMWYTSTCTLTTCI